MRAIAVKCPQCGATLSADGDVAAVTCSYCGTTSRIQQRTRVFQVPRPMPPPPQHGYGHHPPPMPVARQKVSPLFFAVPAMVTVGMAAGGVYFTSRGVQRAQHAVEATQQAAQAQTAKVAAAAARPDWWGEPPLLLDVDGDGADELVGLVRYIGTADSAHLAAFSAATGERLWQGPSLGKSGELTQAVLGKSGDLVLMATEDGVLHAYDRKDGSSRWDQPMGEKIQVMCATPVGGEVVIRTADNRWTVVDAAGATRPGKSLLQLETAGSKPRDALARFRAIGAEVPPGVCLRADNTSWQAPLGGVLTIDHWSKLPEPASMRVGRLIRQPGGPVVAVGSKRSGTSVPMLGRLDGDKARWTTEIPASEPLTARSDDHAVALSATAVYAIYQLQNPTRERVAAFSLEDGTRIWDQPLDHGAMMVNIVGAVATGDVVLVVSWGAMRAFDQKDGTVRYTIGKF